MLSYKAEIDFIHKSFIHFGGQTEEIKMQTCISGGFCYSLVTVSVLVNIATLRHHGLFVQSKRQFQLKQKTRHVQK